MEASTMGPEGVGGSNTAKQSQLQPLARQNSMYNLTLDEVQNHLGDLGKPLSSMNLDELLKSVCTAEANQSMMMDMENTTLPNQSSLQREGSLSLNSDLCKKTVDEVWRGIQRGQNGCNERTTRERQPTLGEMTLEDFLVKAGIVSDGSLDKKNESPVVSVDPGTTQSTPQFSQQGQWMQYQQQQFQHPQQNMMGVYISGQPMPQPVHMGAGPVLDVSYTDNQLPLAPPLMGTLSETHISGRKRNVTEDHMDKSVERRQKRMIKNRESAARSRARKQAYTNELEIKISRLEKENERLRKRKELENKLPAAPPPEPKFQLRRTSSAPF